MNKKDSKFDFKQFRLLKFSKSPILKLSGVLHTFGGRGPISAIGMDPLDLLLKTLEVKNEIIKLSESRFLIKHILTRLPN